MSPLHKGVELVRQTCALIKSNGLKTKVSSIHRVSLVKWPLHITAYDHIYQSHLITFNQVQQPQDQGDRAQRPCAPELVYMTILSVVKWVIRPILTWMPCLGTQVIAASVRARSDVLALAGVGRDRCTIPATSPTVLQTLIH